MAEDNKDSRDKRRVAPMILVCLAALFSAGGFTAASMAQTDFDPSNYLAKNYQTYASEQLQSTFNASQNETDSQANRHNSSSENKEESLTQVEIDATADSSAYSITGGEADTTVVTIDGNAGSGTASAGTASPNAPIVNPGDSTGGGSTSGGTSDGTDGPTNNKPDYSDIDTYGDLDDTTTYQKDEYGNEVLSLSVSGEFPRAFYYNENISSSEQYTDIVVTATKRDSSGNTFTEDIPYGSYTVSGSTSHSGSSFTALFSYCGTTATLPYSVEHPSYTLKSIVLYKGNYARLSISSSANGYGDLSNSDHYSDSGEATVDESVLFSELIAWYKSGTPKCTSNSKFDTYSPLISWDSDGYLTYMAYGFTENYSTKTGPLGPYSLTVNASGNANREIYFAINGVPEGALLKISNPVRVDGTYQADQVFVACTSVSDDGTYSVPMGTTKIALEACDSKTTTTSAIKTLVIPSSVSSIDAATLSQYATSLERFTVDEDNATFSSKDGLLMNKAGTTVLAVPATVNEITLGEDMQLADDAISNRTGTITINLTDEEPSSDLLASIKAIAENNPSAQIIVNVPNTTDDIAYVRYLAAWGPTLNSSTGNVALGVADKTDIAASYSLQADGAVLSSDLSTLALVPWGAETYTAPSSITKIGSHALDTETLVSLTLESANPPTLGTGVFGDSASGMTVFIPQGSLNDYLGTWTSTLDAEYGTGTTESVLSEQSGLVYLDGAYYQDNGDGTYRLVSVTTAAAADFVPSGKTTSIAANAFANCAQITSISAPEGVTAIEGNVFSGCTNLELVSLPSTLKTLAENAFEGCTALKALACNATSAPSASLTLDAAGVALYVPSHSGSAYSNWGAVSACDASYRLENGLLYGETSNSTSILKAESTISGTITLESPLVSIADYAFANCTALTGVDCSNAAALASIGEGAFSGCAALVDFDLENCTTLTSLGGYAFENCTALVGVRTDDETLLSYPSRFTLPDSLTQASEGWFKGCTSLHAIDFSNLATIPEGSCEGCTALEFIYASDTITAVEAKAFKNCISLASMGFLTNTQCTAIGDEAFYGCSTLRVHEYNSTSTLPDSIESIGVSAFEGCTNLGKDLTNKSRALTLPANLTALHEGAFANCPALTEVTIDASANAISKRCFSGCSSLATVNISTGSSLNLVGVEAFEGCSALTHIDLSNANSLQALGARAFEGCSALAYATLPSSLTSILNNCFADCASLTDINMLGAAAPYLDSTVFGSTVNADALTVYVDETARNAYVEKWTEQLDGDYGEGTTEALLAGAPSGTITLDGVTYQLNDGDGYTLLKAKTTLSGAYEVLAGTTAIASNAFEDCSELTGISFANCDSLTFGDWCFKGCSNLVSVTFNCNVTSMGESVFENCDALETITLDKGFTIDRLGTRCFADCDWLTKLSALKGTITVFGKECFAECDNLASISTAGVKNGLEAIEDGAFKNCASWAGLATNASIVNTWYKNLASIGDEAFAGCTAITKDYLPSGVTAFGDSLYEGCTSLASVTYRGSVTSIGSNCFKDCSSLTSVSPYNNNASGLAALTTIGDNAFENCTSLSMSLGNFTSLATIGNCAFYGCTRLTSASFAASLCSIGTDAFTGCSSLASMEFAGSTAPSIGSFTLPSSMGEGSITCSAYSDDESAAEANESIYNSYLAALTSALGSEDAAKTALAKPSTMTSGSSEDDTTGSSIASTASVEEEATVPESETSRTGETTEQGSTNNAAAGTEGGSGASANENASDTAISSTGEANSASSSSTSNSTSGSNASTASDASGQTSTGTATESEGNSATESNTTASEN